MGLRRVSLPVLALVLTVLPATPGVAALLLGTYWEDPDDGALVYDTVGVRGWAGGEWSAFYVEIDGVEYPAGSGGRWYYAWDTRTHPDGQATLRVHGLRDGLEEWTPARTVTVRNPPPITRVVHPIDRGVLTDATTIRGYAYLSGGVEEVALTGLGPAGASRSIPVSGTESWSGTWDAGAEPEGDWFLEIVATNSAGERASHGVDVQVDLTPPTVTLTEPTDGQVVGTGFFIRGVARDATAISDIEAFCGGVWCADLTGQPVSGPYPGDERPLEASVSTYNLSEGLQEVSVRVSDRARRVTVVTRTIDVDTAGPSLGFDAPTGSRVTGTVTLAGPVDDPHGVTEVTVAVDGSPGEPAGVSGGRWSLLFDTERLAGGSHVFEVRATDGAGNASTVSRWLEVTNAPVLTFDEPPESTLVGVVRLAGSVSDAGPVGVSVLVEGASLPAEVVDGRWHLDLDSGTYPDAYRRVTVLAADTDGHVATVDRYFYFDNGPTVSITSPAPGSSVGGTSLISGIASDPQGVTRVTVAVDAGTQFQAALDGDAWTLLLDTVSYPDGSHRITARALDEQGGVDTRSVDVTFANGSWISMDEVPSHIRGTLRLSGSVYVPGGASGVAVELDGSPMGDATLEPPYQGRQAWTFDLDSTPVVDGRRTLTAVALHLTSRVATRDADVVFDNTPPTLAVDSPLSGEPAGESILIRFSASDWFGRPTVEARIGGPDQPWYRWSWWSSREWGALEVPTSGVPEGPQTLEVRASDDAGNETLRVTEILVDRTGPVVEVSSPPSGWSWQREHVEVRGEVSDGAGVRSLHLSLDGGDPFRLTVEGGAFSTGLDDLPDRSSHTLRFRAVDGVGNVSESFVYFTVDAVPPDLEILEPDEGYVNIGGAPDIGPSPAGTVVFSNSVWVSWNDDSSGRGDVEYCIEPALVEDRKCERTMSPFSNILQEGRPGNVRLTVTAFDQAGNSTVKVLDLLLL